jgi:hypothetical protein
MPEHHSWFVQEVPSKTCISDEANMVERKDTKLWWMNKASLWKGYQATARVDLVFFLSLLLGRLSVQYISSDSSVVTAGSNLIVCFYDWNVGCLSGEEMNRRYEDHRGALLSTGLSLYFRDKVDLLLLTLPVVDRPGLLEFSRAMHDLWLCPLKFRNSTTNICFGSTIFVNIAK